MVSFGFFCLTVSTAVLFRSSSNFSHRYSGISFIMFKFVCSLFPPFPHIVIVGYCDRYLWLVMMEFLVTKTLINPRPLHTVQHCYVLGLCDDATLTITNVLRVMSSITWRLCTIFNVRVVRSINNMMTSWWYKSPPAYGAQHYTLTTQYKMPTFVGVTRASFAVEKQGHMPPH